MSDFKKDLTWADFSIGWHRTKAENKKIHQANDTMSDERTSSFHLHSEAQDFLIVEQ